MADLQPVNLEVSDINMGPAGSPANSNKSLPIASYSDDERRKRMAKETDDMRTMLRNDLRIKAAAQPMNAEEKKRKQTLQTFKYRVLDATNRPRASMHLLPSQFLNYSSVIH
jgi:hypothetical protein